MSHPVWVRGLKPFGLSLCPERTKSHPVWVRGLKPSYITTVRKGTKSHPVWVRGLKQYVVYFFTGFKQGRTPCGCVD